MPMPEGWKGSDGRARAEVCLWLKMHGGEYHQEDGEITGRMKRELGKGRALSQLLSDMEHDGMLTREIRGRRTYSIKLLDDWGLADDLSAQPVFRPPTLATSGGRAVNSKPPEVDYDVLAAHVLAEALKMAQVQPSNGAELERLREKVAELRTERDMARQALDNVTAERDNAVRDADKMRKNVIEAKAEMDRTPKKGGIPIRDLMPAKSREALDRMMRELPTH